MNDSDQHAADAAEVSKRTGVPASMLMHAPDLEEMENLAAALKEEWRKQKTRPIRPLTEREKFAEWLGKEFASSHSLEREFLDSLC